MLAPDAFQGAVANGQIELADETARTKVLKGFAQLDELRFQRRRSLVVLMMSGAGVFEQAGRAVLLEAAQPLTDRGHGGGKEPRGGLDAALFGALDQTQTMVVCVFHLTHQIEITGESSHGATILAFARRPALPPAGRPSPTASSDSHTSTSLGGYDVTGLFHGMRFLDGSACRRQIEKMPQPCDRPLTATSYAVPC